MSTNKQAIAASYSSPLPPTSQTFRHEISTVLDPEGSVANKKAYFAELRGLVTLVQAEMNVFLTERMVEDKQREGGGGGGGKNAEEEAKEEQNYGEENVEDEA